MLSFHSYKNLLEYLDGSGRPVIVHLSTWTRFHKRLRFRIALADIKHCLDGSMTFNRHEDYVLKFKDVDGKRFKSVIHNMREFRVDKIELQKKDSIDVLFFNNYREVIHHLRSHGKEVVIKVSIWTHSSPRMVFHVNFRQLAEFLDKTINLKHTPDNELRIQTTAGEEHSFPFSKLRIAKVDSIQIV